MHEPLRLYIVFLDSRNIHYRMCKGLRHIQLNSTVKILILDKQIFDKQIFDKQIFDKDIKVYKRCIVCILF